MGDETEQEEVVEVEVEVVEEVEVEEVEDDEGEEVVEEAFSCMYIRKGSCWATTR